MKKIFAMIGAIARYNYGDLLFPVLAEKEFSPLRDDYDFICYGLKESDLSRFGARKTHALRELIGNPDLNSGSVICVVGGDVLGINWVPMHIHRLSRIRAFLFSRFFLIFGKLFGLGFRINRYLARRYGASPFMLPWIVPASAFHPGVRIVYNAVGGSGLNTLIPPYRDYLRDNLNRADLISVRDMFTRDQLIRMGVDKPIYCVPDSAVTMSVHFPVEELHETVSPALLEKLDAWKFNYVCFQINYTAGIRHFDAIIEQMTRIGKTWNLPILLLPVGLVPMHDDQIVLRRFRETLAASCHLPENLSIHEIMYCIARSRLFIGTSLHGAVTALSYAVPHIGLVEDVPKLRALLKDWDVGPLTGGTAVDQIADHAETAIRMDSKLLEENRDRLIGLVHENYRRMREVLAGPVRETGNRPIGEGR